MLITLSSVMWMVAMMLKTLDLTFTSASWTVVQLIILIPFGIQFSGLALVDMVDLYYKRYHPDIYHFYRRLHNDDIKDCNYQRHVWLWYLEGLCFVLLLGLLLDHNDLISWPILLVPLFICEFHSFWLVCHWIYDDHEQRHGGIQNRELKRWYFSLVCLFFFLVGFNLFLIRLVLYLNNPLGVPEPIITYAFVYLDCGLAFLSLLGFNLWVV